MTTVKELLEAYVAARLTVISERSGDALTDWKVLVQEVETFAALHDVDADDVLTTVRERIGWVT